jgi:hypothetical protein
MILFHRNVLMLALAIAVYPLAGYAQSAGRIEFAVGNVSAIAANGYPRSLRKGAEINSGDTVITDNEARAQVHFSDGGYISLQPNTRFQVEEYRYLGSADGSERGFFSLVKGGLRAVTGIIGKHNKSNYQVNTAVATIGIRGTHFTLRLCESDCIAGGSRLANGLYASVGEGQIFMANAVGRLDLEQGQRGFVANLNTPPRPTDRPPPLSAPQMDKKYVLLAANQDIFVAGDLRNSVGLPKNLQNATQTLPLTGAVVSDVGASLPTLDIGTVDGTGRLLKYSSPTGAVIGHGTTFVEANTDGSLIAWGRWTKGQTEGTPLDFVNDQSLHYVVTAKPSPNSAITSPNGGTLTYTLLGGTSATSNTGGIGTGIQSGTLTLTLGSVSATLNANFNVDYGGATYNTTASAPVTSAVFTGTGVATGGLACGAGCVTTINGVFAGPNAERAGLVYGISDTAATGAPKITGAAVFAQK